MKKIYAVFIASFLMLGSETFAQVDPAKVLIGRWVGWAELLSHQDRTLLINIVTPEGDGQWTARGIFGLTSFVDITKRKGGNVDISITSKNNEIFIDFVQPADKMAVSVKLVGEDKLEGTIETIGGSNKVIKIRIAFEKKSN